MAASLRHPPSCGALGRLVALHLPTHRGERLVVKPAPFGRVLGGDPEVRSDRRVDAGGPYLGERLLHAVVLRAAIYLPQIDRRDAAGMRYTKASRWPESPIRMNLRFG